MAVLSFLKSRRDERLGYTAEEVMVELGNWTIYYRIEDIVTGLEALVKADRAESKSIDGEIYYRYFDWFGFRPRRYHAN